MIVWVRKCAAKVFVALGHAKVQVNADLPKVAREKPDIRMGPVFLGLVNKQKVVNL